MPGFVGPIKPAPVNEGAAGEVAKLGANAVKAVTKPVADKLKSAAKTKSKKSSSSTSSTSSGPASSGSNVPGSPTAQFLNQPRSKKQQKRAMQMLDKLAATHNSIEQGAHTRSMEKTAHNTTQMNLMLSHAQQYGVRPGEINISHGADGSHTMGVTYVGHNKKPVPFENAAPANAAATGSFNPPGEGNRSGEVVAKGGDWGSWWNEGKTGDIAGTGAVSQGFRNEPSGPAYTVAVPEAAVPTQRVAGGGAKPKNKKPEVDRTNAEAVNARLTGFEEEHFKKIAAARAASNKGSSGTPTIIRSLDQSPEETKQRANDAWDSIAARRQKNGTASFKSL